MYQVHHGFVGYMFPLQPSDDALSFPVASTERDAFPVVPEVTVPTKRPRRITPTPIPAVEAGGDSAAAPLLGPTPEMLELFDDGDD